MSNCKFLALVTGLFLAASVSAQVDFRGGLNFGAITSQVDGDDFSGFSKFGLYLGGQVGLEFSERSSVLLEIMYAQKGSRNAPNLSDPNSDAFVFKLKLDYVELPVSYQYRVNDRLTAHAGMYWARLIRGYQETSSSGRDDLDGAFSKADIGFQIGGQFELSDTSYLRLRYSGSAIPMRGDDASVTNGNYWRSGGYNIVLYLGYGFSF